MTVKDTIPEHQDWFLSIYDDIVCTWFDESGNMGESTFKDKMLEKL